MDAERFGGWVERYRSAWESNDPGSIADLFTPNGLYFDSPGGDPWRGREAIVEGWLERQDPPGETTFEYEVIAAEGDLGIVRGLTRYLSNGNLYDNLWEISLAADDRCRSFTEWWILHPEPPG